MAQSDADLLIEISATTELLRQQVVKADGIIGNFQRETNRKLGKVDSDFNKVGKSVDNLHGNFKSLAAVGVASLGAAFSVDILTNFARNALDTGSALSEMSQQLGVSVKDLQEFTFLGEQAGISAEEMQKALQKLTRTVGETAAGSKKGSAAFAELGINIRNADGSLKSAGQLLPEIAGGLEQIPDPANRARLQVALFGKAGQQLAPLLNEGAAGISRLRAEYEKMGIALSDDQAKQLDEASDAYEKFKTRLQGKFTIWFAEYGIPAIEDFARTTKKELDGISSLWDRVTGKIQAAPRQAVRGGSNSGANGSISGTNPAFFGGPTGFNQPLVKKPFSLIRNFLPAEDFGAGGGGGFGSAPSGPAISGSLAGFDDLLASTLDTLDDRIATFGDTINDDIGVYADEYGRIIDAVEAAQDVSFAGTLREMDQREESIRAQAGLYETLMTQGTKGFLRTLEAEGLRIVAEMVARLLSGQSINSAFSGAAKNSVFGSILKLGGSFGGFFANGGQPPVGKASIVGERGAELFVPKVPGTIFPAGSFGGGTSVSMTINAPGATAETVAMIRRELAAAAPAIAAHATQSTVKALTRPRMG